MIENNYEVLIVGAGPVGLYTGYYCGLRKLKTLVCDSLEHIGGQLYNLYPEKIIYDLPGYEAVTAKSFIEKLEVQINQVSEYVEVKVDVKIEGIQKIGEQDFLVTTNRGEFRVGAVILAMGNGSFAPIKLGVEAEERFTNLKYFVRHLEDYRDQNVVIFGGGDSAIDWSLMLENIAKSVTLVHRRQEFRAKPANVETLLKSKVQVLTPYVFVNASEVGDRLETLTIKDNEGNLKTLTMDHVIVSYGTTVSNQLIKQWDLELYNQRVLINQQSMTSTSGIFACGDVTGYEGRQIQIINGLSEGMMASVAAYRYLHPEQSAKPVR